MHKVMTYAVVVFQDLSNDTDETESERWSLPEREPFLGRMQINRNQDTTEVEQEIIAQDCLKNSPQFG